MGVYIKHMDKPKFCKCEEYNCFAWDDEKYKCKITEWKKPCPLIEIVTCGECKWLGIDDGMTFCNVWLREVERHMFCSYGERRK